MSPEPVTPAPVPVVVDQHLHEILTQIPNGKRGVLVGTVTTQGGEVAIGQRFTRGRLEGQVSGWAAREWGTGATSAGVRGQFSW